MGTVNLLKYYIRFKGDSTIPFKHIVERMSAEKRIEKLYTYHIYLDTFFAKPTLVKTGIVTGEEVYKLANWCGDLIRSTKLPNELSLWLDGIFVSSYITEEYFDFPLRKFSLKKTLDKTIKLEDFLNA